MLNKYLFITSEIRRLKKTNQILENAQTTKDSIKYSLSLKNLLVVFLCSVVGQISILMLIDSILIVPDNMEFHLYYIYEQAKQNYPFIYHFCVLSSYLLVINLIGQSISKYNKKLFKLKHHLKMIKYLLLFTALYFFKIDVFDFYHIIYAVFVFYFVFFFIISFDIIFFMVDDKNDVFKSQKTLLRDFKKTKSKNKGINKKLKKLRKEREQLKTNIINSYEEMKKVIHFNCNEDSWKNKKKEFQFVYIDDIYEIIKEAKRLEYGEEEKELNSFIENKFNSKKIVNT